MLEFGDRLYLGYNGLMAVWVQVPLSVNKFILMNKYLIINSINYKIIVYRGYKI